MKFTELENKSKFTISKDLADFINLSSETRFGKQSQFSVKPDNSLKPFKEILGRFLFNSYVEFRIEFLKDRLKICLPDRVELCIYMNKTIKCTDSLLITPDNSDIFKFFELLNIEFEIE